MADDRNSVGSVSLDLEVNTSNLENDVRRASDRISGRVERSSGNAFGAVRRDAQRASTSAQRSFESGASGITRALSGIAKKAAGFFALKKLFDFGKESVKLGSDLAEVENVVDVTFGNMSAKVDEFAKSAISTFGLSDTMAKKYVGTFGAMAKAFGFSEDQAYDMSSTLTGLAGDVASFYNITQDEAYTKLKSVFTGETESLKELGVVMTQTALDSFALANGFGKTTKEMSEAEKVALRYQFVQQQLSAASGDFVRTSGSWANQVRVLKLQFDSLKASIGQGLINVLLPVVKSINVVLGRLVTLANAFRSFTEMITGNKSSSGGGGALAEAMGDMPDATGVAADGLDGVADAADNAADASGAAGKAAKKAAKEMRSLAGFDKINKLEAPDDDSDTGTGSSPSGGLGSLGGAAGALGSAVNLGGLAQGETILDKLGDKFKGLIDRAKELANLFKKGFKIGFGDSQKKIESIKAGLKNIGDRLREIFTDPQVVTAANNMFDSFAYNAGRVAGSMASIGLSIANNLVSGISQYLDESADYIKARLVGIFDASATIANLIGDVYQAIATIYDVLNGENAIACTAALIGIFADGFLGITELALKFGADIISLITGPFVDNAELIKQTIDNTLAPISVVLNTIWESVKSTVEKAIEIYDEHVHPLFESLRDGISEIVETFLNGYNEHMAPVLDSLAEKFREVWEEHIQPAIDGFLELFGKVADLVKARWENTYKPFVQWIADKIWPVIAPVFKQWGETALTLSGIFFDVIKTIEDLLGGLLDFLTAVFKGDWEGAWNAIKETFSSVWDDLANIVREPVNQILDYAQVLVDGVAAAVNGIADMFNSLQIDVPEGVPFVGGMTLEFNIPTWSPPTLPRLAQGGYIAANTPRLAMIGDNRTQGEIVSPEDKLEEMATAAARAAIEAYGGITRAELESIINNSTMRIIAALAQVGFYIDGQLLARMVKKAMSELDYRYNPVEIG